MAPRRAELEGEKRPARPRKGAGKEQKWPHAESDDEFDLGLAEGAKDRSAEESVSKRGGSNRKKEQKLVEHGEDEANKGEKAITKTWSDMVKGLKTEDELETANSDETKNRSETADSFHMFDSETPN